jgi:hypothetical protein
MAKAKEETPMKTTIRTVAPISKNLKPPQQRQIAGPGDCGS